MTTTEAITTILAHRACGHPVVEAAMRLVESAKATNDLAMMVRRLSRLVAIDYCDQPTKPLIIEQSRRLLRRLNLQGSPLREGEE